MAMKKHELFDTLSRTLQRLRNVTAPEAAAALGTPVSANYVVRTIPGELHALRVIIGQAKAFDDATKPVDAPHGAMVAYARDQYGRPTEDILGTLGAIRVAAEAVLDACKAATPVQVGTLKLDIETLELAPDGRPTGSTSVRVLQPGETAAVREALLALPSVIPDWV
jgi:hypothetical protein